MSINGSDSPPWSFIQWSGTALATALASSIAFVWRLSQKVEKFEAELEAQGRVGKASSEAAESAIVRLTEKLERVHDDHYRIRETIGALPTRSELRDAEDRITEQLSTLASRTR